MVWTGFGDANKRQCTTLGLATPGDCYHPEAKGEKVESYCHSLEAERTLSKRAVIDLPLPNSLLCVCVCIHNLSQFHSTKV